jgi:predicted transcriptional regulator
MKVVIFQLRLTDDFNTKVKIMATTQNMSKHDYIETAIKEKIENDKLKYV